MSHKHHQEHAECEICKKTFPLKNLVPYELVTSNVSKLIHDVNTQWIEGKHICHEDLNKFRAEFMTQTITENQIELNQLEKEVLESMRDQDLISENINTTYQGTTTFGERVADKIAEFGGSWKFILSFFFVLISWIIFNSLSFLGKQFDPYPFILLNLVLSCLASVQAPIIMMSQNRQASKDRMQSEMDYKVNLKAELEIRHLRTKLDQLSSYQWQRLLEIQEMQAEIIQELAKK